MKTYFSLLIRPEENADWGVYFGDYDHETVMDERDELIDGGMLRKNIKIIRSAEAQADIQHAVDMLNGHPAKPADSNLTLHRKKLVRLCCEAMQRHEGSPVVFRATTYGGEEITPPGVAANIIVNSADDCDAIVIRGFAARAPEGQQRCFVSIIWGNGVGCAISDYSFKLEEQMKPAMDFCEFLEI